MTNMNEQYQAWEKHMWSPLHMYDIRYHFLSLLYVFFLLFDTHDNVNIFPNELIMNIIRIPHLNKYRSLEIYVYVSSFSVFFFFFFCAQFILLDECCSEEDTHTKKNMYIFRTIWILSREFINYFLSDHPDTTQSAAKISFLSHRTALVSFRFVSFSLLCQYAILQILDIFLRIERISFQENLSL